MAFKMKNPSVAKLAKNAGNNRNEKNANGLREDTPRSPLNPKAKATMRRIKRPKIQGYDQNKSIVRQAPSQFYKDITKPLSIAIGLNRRMNKAVKDFGKKTGITKNIKKKAKKVKNYFGFYN
tara:strand:+ start:61 stop:426 length:366 start_codon:yes stop_codon:yes gene_type:complete